MDTLNFFYAGEGIDDLGHLEISEDLTVKEVKQLVCESHNLDVDTHFFLEDSDQPIDDASRVGELASDAGIKAHLHRCHRVKVEVAFNCDTISWKFSPSTTIKRVHRWAVRKLELSAEDAAEYVLQIEGTNEQPPLKTHIGSLVEGRECDLSFDLVPDDRIQGCHA